MRNIPDYELLKTGDEPPGPEPTPRPSGWMVAALLVVVVSVGIAVYFIYTRRPPASAPAPVAKAAAPVPKPVRPLGGNPESVDVPPLGESDQVVRDLVRQITSNAAALSWLTTTGLIRNFAVVVENLVEGVTPAKHLAILRPKSPFRVVTHDGQLFIDPGSYERYNALADAAGSIDPDGAARVYATLKPRIEEAYGELGLPPGSFDRALERAIVSLLQTPIVDGPVRVEPHGGVGYEYADPRLENLTAAQRQLLRTGPRNVRIVQTALRRLALALGVPSERLP
jgi:hypothetical protein